jgi:hypothetical protein
MRPLLLLEVVGSCSQAVLPQEVPGQLEACLWWPWVEEGRRRVGADRGCLRTTLLLGQECQDTRCPYFLSCLFSYAP